MSASLPRKELFDIPEGMIYLDGNSLGPLPKSVPAAVTDVVSQQWSTQLIKGWNKCGWMEQPSRVGDKIAQLVGAENNTITMGDTLSVKVFQALASGIKMRPERKVILSDSGNFPSDLYMAQGLIELIGDDYELRIVEPEDVISHIDDSIAIVMLTHIDYRSGRMHDMEIITKAAHNANAVMVWDLAHSAGALPVDLKGLNCEFAVGCTYKYLNAGPGAPAFIYVRPDLIDNIEPALSGWLGHEAPFAFEQGYRPAPSIDRMRVGTPPVIQMAALEAALSVWDDVSLDDLRTKCVSLSELFIKLIEEQCPALKLYSPRDSAVRGSQVSFAFDEGYAAMQAIIARGVVGDFRAPNLMRFGITPLYIDEQDIVAAVGIIKDVMDNEIWAEPQYQVRSAVT